MPQASCCSRVDSLDIVFCVILKSKMRHFLLTALNIWPGDVLSGKIVDGGDNLCDTVSGTKCLISPQTGTR